MQVLSAAAETYDICEVDLNPIRILAASWYSPVDGRTKSCQLLFVVCLRRLQRQIVAFVPCLSVLFAVANIG